MSTARLLARMEAPRELVAAMEGLELDEAFAQASDPELVVWLAGAASLELGTAFTLLSERFAAICGASGERVLAREIEEAIAAGTRTRSYAAALELAESLEGAGETPPRTLRRAEGKSFARLARAGALLLRGAEALGAAHELAYAAHRERARAVANMVGGGMSLHAGGGAALRLDAERLPGEPLDAVLLAAVAAMAGAAAELAALEARDELPTGGNEGTLADALRDALYAVDFG